MCLSQKVKKENWKERKIETPCLAVDVGVWQLGENMPPLNWGNRNRGCLRPALQLSSDRPAEVSGSPECRDQLNPGDCLGFQWQRIYNEGSVSLCLREAQENSLIYLELAEWHKINESLTQRKCVLTNSSSGCVVRALLKHMLLEEAADQLCVSLEICAGQIESKKWSFLPDL